MNRFKKFPVLVLVAVATSVMLALSGCASIQGLFGQGSAKFVIIHTNDTHGYDQASETSLGMAAVAQLKADYEADGYDVLLLDAGDAFQGNILASDSKGQAIVGFMNECDYDAMALGNHEFDYGADVLQERMEACDFPVLAANITIDATGEPFAQPHTVFQLSDGTKVGVFGLATPETLTQSATKNTAGLSFAAGEDLYACAQQQIDELQAEGCEVVVCLGHLGEGEEAQPNRASDVVENTEGMDLFIDAHDHEVEDAVLKDKAGNEVLVVETGCYLANIGVLTYKKGSFTEELVAVGEYDGIDADLAQQIDEVAAEIDGRLSVKVGETSFALSGEKSPGVRDQEMPLGDFAADALLWQAAQALGTQPDAAIFNGGGLRAGLEEGDITLGNLLDVEPFMNQLYVIQVTGAQLLEALEAATQQLPEPMGSFPQVSGITFTVDLTVPYEKGEQYPYSTYYAPANPGARVQIQDVNGKGFDLDASYSIAMSNFLATGGDTYHVFAEAAEAGMQTTGYFVYEALRYYLADACGSIMPDAYAQPQGRVMLIVEDQGEASGE